MSIIESRLIKREKNLRIASQISAGEVELSPRPLPKEEKHHLLAAAPQLRGEPRPNLFGRDAASFEKASREIGRRQSFNFNQLLASVLLTVVLTTFLSFADSKNILRIPRYEDFSTSKYQAASIGVVSDVFKNFPSDLPPFFRWLGQGAKNFLAIFKIRPLSELVTGPLPEGAPKIIRPGEAVPSITTLAEAEALDALSGLAQVPIGEEGLPGAEGLPVSGVAGLDNRLLVIEAELKEQKELIKAGLIFQSDFFSAFKALSDFVPKHPPSTIVVQGQPATLTSYAVQPIVASGFDHLSANYFNLANNATINGSLTVKSGGTFDTLSVTGNSSIGGTFSVTGNTSLTGNLSVGGTLSVTGDSTVGNLTVTGALTAPTNVFTNASTTYFTVTNT
ncbi:MAG: hypothetical protein HYS78_02580, partial [Parcubacteria group bacterium]|nr:hypothetical protein [Parcubacteria group bacterium]